jgi:hypothetical protein
MVQGSPGTGVIPAKGFGSGPRNNNDAYWFNMTSSYAQCDFSNAAPNFQQCDFFATAYRYDPVLDQDRVFDTDHWFLNRCNSQTCDLEEIHYKDTFKGLSALSFYSVINAKIVDFYIDSIELQWYNNTCAAGLERSSSRR